MQGRPCVERGNICPGQTKRHRLSGLRGERKKVKTRQIGVIEEREDTMKKFWKKTEGFTLVELIVVIAILGILAGVGTVGYSGYIKKANMAADQQLVSGIENAMLLSFYNNEMTGSASIILSVDGIENADEIAEDSPLYKAMAAAYGDDWMNTLKLEYNGWIGMTSDEVFAAAYQNSSYSGNETALISQVGSVTNMLKDALASAPNLVGSSFNGYLTETGVDTNDNQAVSNAAILYAADTIGNMSAAQEAAVNTAFANFYDPTSPKCGQIGDLTLALKDELGTFGAVAALYAHGEAFGQYVANNGNTDLLDDFHAIDVSAVTDTDAALNQVAGNLDTLVGTAKTDPTINPFALQYIADGQYAKDVTAYLKSMDIIDKNADKFTDKLDSAGCYTDGTAAAMLQAAVDAGSLGISTENGEVAIWICNGVTGNTVSGIQN